jgi:hypothetical protein
MLTYSLILLQLTCAQSAGEFEIRVIGGTSRTVKVESIASDGSLTVAGGDKVAAGDWYSLRRSPGVLPDWPRSAHIELTNGDRVCGTIAGADGDALRLRLPIPGKEQVLRFPLSALCVAWLVRRPLDDPAWLNAPRKRDVIQTRTGDVATGALASIDVERNIFRWQVDGRDQQQELSRICAIGFNTDLARVRRPKGVYYRLVLLDGTRLSVTSIAFDGTNWTAQSLFKDPIRISSDQLMSIDVEQGKVAMLSDLKPAAYQYQSFDGEQYSWSADRCVSGDALRLKTANGESTFDRGVGLHAECTITYALGGKYSRFEAIAGLDSRTGVKGDAVLAVSVDGKEQELANGGKLTFAGGPIALNIDVKGAKELKIVVRRDNGGNVQDHVNLAEARLVP